MHFGLSMSGHASAAAEVEVAVIAEQSGFDHVWTWDNQILGKDAFVLLSLAAAATRRVTLGTCVTQPVTRDSTVLAGAFATLNNHTGGRMICGIGRGDGAVRIQRGKPSNLAALEEAIRVIRGLASGSPTSIDGHDLQLSWAEDHALPIYVSAYGPKALALAGRVAEGVILQVADPDLVAWFLKHVHAAAEAAGRDPQQIRVQCAAPLLIGQDRERLRENVRWFPAVVGNHIADMLRHHPASELPDALTRYVESRTKYDYRDHTERHAEHANYVPDEIIDRFTVIGTVEECVAHLRELEAAGVTEFNIYPSVADSANLVSELGPLVRQVGQEIIPAMTEQAAASQAGVPR
jgi:probable F420-dependent oxidoreductase